MASEERRNEFEIVASAIEKIFAKFLEEEVKMPDKWQWLYINTAINAFKHGRYDQANQAIVNCTMSKDRRSDAGINIESPKNISEVKNLKLEYEDIKSKGPQPPSF